MPKTIAEPKKPDSLQQVKCKKEVAEIHKHTEEEKKVIQNQTRGEMKLIKQTFREREMGKTWKPMTEAGRKGASTEGGQLGRLI